MKRRLSIPKPAIFESRVCRGIPSFAAAPEGPEIRPWLSANADSIISFSRSVSVAIRGIVRPATRAGFPLQPGRIDGERLAFAQNYGPLNDVLQLAHVSRPVVRLKNFNGVHSNGAERLARLPGIALDEMLDKQRNIVQPLPQRRHMDRENIQPVKHVLAERARR